MKSKADFQIEYLETAQEMLEKGWIAYENYERDKDLPFGDRVMTATPEGKAFLEGVANEDN